MPSTAAHSQQQPPQPLQHGCAYSDAGDICERPPAGQAPCRPVGAICAAVRPERRSLAQQRQQRRRHGQADSTTAGASRPMGYALGARPGAHTSPTYAATSIGGGTGRSMHTTTPRQHHGGNPLQPATVDQPSGGTLLRTTHHDQLQPHRSRQPGQPRPQQLAGAPAPAGDTTQAAVAHRPTQGTVLAASNMARARKTACRRPARPKDSQ